MQCFPVFDRKWWVPQECVVYELYWERMINHGKLLDFGHLHVQTNHDKPICFQDVDVFLAHGANMFDTGKAQTAVPPQAATIHPAHIHRDHKASSSPSIEL